MPTERFYRLPAEKAEAIRAAAIREFMRVSPEEASINRIIRDAEISRGSFYTYFEDKYELLKWIIGDRIQEHQRAYAVRMQEVNGDIWDTLEWIFAYSIDRTLDDGFMEIIGNVVESSVFSAFLKHGCDEEAAANEQNQDYVGNLYQQLDKKKYPMSRQTFYDLMETHGMIFLMSLKQLFRDKMPKEQAVEYYKRHIRMLRYGVCPEAAEHKNNERQEENNKV